MSLKTCRWIWFVCSVALSTSCLHPSRGEEIYTKTCSYCHMEDGNGLAELIPAFKPTAFEANRQILVCAVTEGIDDRITGRFMPEYQVLSDADLANVLNYIRSLKSQTSQPFTDKEVRSLRVDCSK